MTHILIASLPGRLLLHVIDCTQGMVERSHIPSRMQSGKGPGNEAKEVLGLLVWLFDNNDGVISCNSS